MQLRLWSRPRPAASDRLTHVESPAPGPARHGDLAGLGRPVGGRGLPGHGYRATLGAPGRGRRPRLGRPACGDVDGHCLRQVTRLRPAGVDRDARGPLRGTAATGSRCHRAVPVTDQGAGERPDDRTAGAGYHRAPHHHLRRGQPARGQGLGSRPCADDPHQPRHAASHAAPRPCPVGQVPRCSAVRGGRRVPSLPGCLRRPCRADSAPAAPVVRPVRRASHVHPGLGDRGRTAGVGRTSHRPAGPGSHRGRFAPRGDDGRAVGAAAHLVARGARRTGHGAR